MAKKIEWMKYAAQGLGAVAVPKLVMQYIPQVTSMLANVPIVNQEFMGITILGVALAGTGVGLVDYFMK